MPKSAVSLYAVAVLVLLAGCFGSDTSEQFEQEFEQGQEAGRLREENARLISQHEVILQELGAERTRSAQLEAEQGNGHRTLSLMGVSLVVLGCALAAVLFIHLQRGRYST